MCFIPCMLCHPSKFLGNSVCPLCQLKRLRLVLFPASNSLIHRDLAKHYQFPSFNSLNALLPSIPTMGYIW